MNKELSQFSWQPPVELRTATNGCISCLHMSLWFVAQEIPFMNVEHAKTQYHNGTRHQYMNQSLMSTIDLRGQIKNQHQRKRKISPINISQPTWMILASWGAGDGVNVVHFCFFPITINQSFIRTWLLRREMHLWIRVMHEGCRDCGQGNKSTLRWSEKVQVGLHEWKMNIFQDNLSWIMEVVMHVLQILLS